ncbi:MAG: tetratricopeptide repeat protein [Anaerolineales bacterium]|nr:tetratricopeptide repeat protein [Anaerolineales bacterium]
MPLFRKKQEVNVATYRADPTEIDPKTSEDYIKRGYAYHARKEFTKADADLQQAVSLDATSPEAYYALGLNLKALERKDEAIKAFQKSLELIPTLEEQNIVRAHMLTRITKGHINQLVKGDWDLRTEFWSKEA